MAMVQSSRRLLRRRVVLGLVCAGCVAPMCRARAEATAPEPGGRPVFLDIDRIVISVFRGKDVDRHEMISMKLELVDDTAIPAVQAAMPRLRDAFIRAWNAIGAQPDAATRGLDIAAGRQRMLAACDRLVGPGRVHNVLIVAQSSRNVTPTRR